MLIQDFFDTRLKIFTLAPPVVTVTNMRYAIPYGQLFVISVSSVGISGVILLIFEGKQLG